MVFNSPLFILTSDVDWASDACIEDLAESAAEFGVKPVFMATGKSFVLDRLSATGQIELGLHPNFRPRSDHGADEESVIAHVRKLYPQATTFRSHCFVDSSQIANAMYGHGIKYDSNLCLYMQPDLVPLRHSSGSLRFPVFWEDDVHWSNKGSWDFGTYADAFFSPGLKVINVHPISFAMNIPDATFYRSITDGKTLTRADIESRRCQGQGARTFALDLFRRVREAGMRFYTLEEAYALCSSKVEAPDAAGRTDQLTDKDHADYWRADNTAKQQSLKVLYNSRNAADPYATSRDFQLRELEIEAIRRNLTSGTILDLGCGNGYTLISLARVLPTARMVGIDFSERLIEGAEILLKRETLPNPPQFVCADAIAYLAKQEDRSADTVITERFLLNMPDVQTQKAVISDAYRVLKPGGRLIMCEGSNEGFNALNALRKALGLDIVPNNSADNLSAIRFDDNEIEVYVAELGFKQAEKLGFSTYFTISRALHPLLIAPQKPSFSARINDLARRIQMAVPLSVGVGSNVVWILQKPYLQADAR